MKCHFCFREGEVPNLSREHLLSRPVAEAFGIDRSALFGQVGEDPGSVALSRLDGISVRFVCEPCNNGWMNVLEHKFAALADWVREPGTPMSPAQVDALCAWSLKTYVVLSVMVGETRRFMDNPSGPGVIPNFTRARQLYEGDPQAFDGMAFGLARPRTGGQFAYAFGNPTVVPVGPKYANRKSAGMAIVAVGTLLIWVVDPTFFHTARISLPEGVAAPTPGLTYGATGEMPFGLSSLDDVVVDNGEHDWAAIVDRLTDWVTARPSEGSS